MIKHLRNIVLFACILLPYSIYAQPGNPSDGPISGGLVFLLIGGLTLGIVKLKKKR